MTDRIFGDCSMSPYVTNYYSLALILKGTPLSHDTNSGVIVSNRSLVMQRITVANAGDYHCLASNRHGAGKSNPVNLRVRCEKSTDER